MFHIVTEASEKNEFRTKLNSLRRDSGVRFGYKLYEVTFPGTLGFAADEWKNLFAACASQRLFYARLMEDVDAVLYMDTDTLFMTPPENVWALFARFNSSHLVGMVPEMTGSDYTDSWYEVHLGLPHYGQKGINSGVMLMNLTRIRADPWEYTLATYLVKYKETISLGDQDLLNIYFHFHPDRLFLAPCEINYRSDFCWGKRVMCDRPPKILHVSRGIWDQKQPAFKTIFYFFQKFQLTDPKQVIPYAIRMAADKMNCNEKPTLCEQSIDLLIGELFKHLA